MTIIIDTTTGQITSERLTEEYSTIQLTDTAFFDGRTAYNLSDGQAIWKKAYLSPAPQATIRSSSI